MPRSILHRTLRLLQHHQPASCCRATTSSAGRVTLIRTPKVWRLNASMDMMPSRGFHSSPHPRALPAVPALIAAAKPTMIMLTKSCVLCLSSFNILTRMFDVFLNCSFIAIRKTTIFIIAMVVVLFAAAFSSSD